LNTEEKPWFEDKIQTVLGQEVIYIPAKAESNGLLVFFSAMNLRRKYDRINWFKTEESRGGFSFLFLNNLGYDYYLGNDIKPYFHTFEKIIRRFAKYELNSNNIYTIGSSMGGYAAIYYAFKMKLKGAIVGVPQVNKRFALMHTHKNWIKAINSTGSQWVDLDILLNQPHLDLPKLYLEYGNYPADKYAALSLVEIYQNRSGLLITRKAAGNEHTYFMSPEIITSTVNFFINENFTE
jgi:hypothetical protein